MDAIEKLFNAAKNYASADSNKDLGAFGTKRIEHAERRLSKAEEELWGAAIDYVNDGSMNKDEKQALEALQLLRAAFDEAVPNSKMREEWREAWNKSGAVIRAYEVRLKIAKKGGR